jgi:hypothetical protein
MKRKASPTMVCDELAEYTFALLRSLRSISASPYYFVELSVFRFLR